MGDDIIRRKAERTCFCRGCGVTMEKGTELIYTYSTLNRGQRILFCLSCAKTIGELSKPRCTKQEDAILRGEI